jgi:hypothetical protein
VLLQVGSGLFDDQSIQNAQFQIRKDQFGLGVRRDAIGHSEPEDAPAQDTLSLLGELVQSIMSHEITYTFRRPNIGIDRTAKRGNRLFRVSAIPEVNCAPDNSLFICPLSGDILMPSENLKVWTASAFQPKETSRLKSTHNICFAPSSLLITIRMGQAVPLTECQ